MTLGRGLNPQAAIDGQGEGFTLVGWSAGYVRGLELGLCRDDQLDAIAHGLMFNLQTDATGNRKNSIAESVRTTLSINAEWVIPLSAEEIEVARLRTTPA